MSVCLKRSALVLIFFLDQGIVIQLSMCCKTKWVVHELSRFGGCEEREKWRI